MICPDSAFSCVEVAIFSHWTLAVNLIKTPHSTHGSFCAGALVGGAEGSLRSHHGTKRPPAGELGAFVRFMKHCLFFFVYTLCLCTVGPRAIIVTQQDIL